MRIAVIAAFIALVASCPQTPSEGEGDPPAEGEGEGDPGEGEGEGEGETCSAAADCAALIYTPCTCTDDDPCSWSGDGTCDAVSCEKTFGFSFDDGADCEPNPCAGFDGCVDNGVATFDGSQSACDGATDLVGILRTCANTDCVGIDCHSCLVESQFCVDARSWVTACASPTCAPQNINAYCGDVSACASCSNLGGMGGGGCF